MRQEATSSTRHIHEKRRESRLIHAVPAS